jgi:hypothetical protein
MENRRKMLSFELSAIDLILVISVIVLFILYMTKLSAKKPEDEMFKELLEKNAEKKYRDSGETSFGNRISSYIRGSWRHSKNKVSVNKYDDTECPRGFGKIKKLNDNNSVSERCLSCYNFMDCYEENKIKTTYQ